MNGSQSSGGELTQLTRTCRRSHSLLCKWKQPTVHYIGFPFDYTFIWDYLFRPIIIYTTRFQPGFKRERFEEEWLGSYNRILICKVVSGVQNDFDKLQCYIHFHKCINKTKYNYLLDGLTLLFSNCHWAPSKLRSLTSHSSSQRTKWHAF